jgi:hypothetical protein
MGRAEKWVKPVYSKYMAAAKGKMIIDKWI